MRQASDLIDVLKRGLRERGLTYARVAEELAISESSVKRMFSVQNMSLDRLAQVCALMSLEITDLLELARAAEARTAELTEEQERTLVSDPKLLLAAILAINHWTASAILEAYEFSETELVGLLARLDRLQIIDLLPGNRIRVRLARNFAWRKDGPFQHFFEERLQDQFFKSSFSGPGEVRIMATGSLSARSNELLQQRVRKMAEEFDRLVEEDRALAHAARDGTTLVMAMRPGDLGLFTKFKRKRPLEKKRSREAK
jgi:DNA-binding Xre family transcriptional regulator